MLKKAMIFGLLLCLLAALFAVPAGAYPVGDVNGDGSVGADDARLALRRSVDLETFAPQTTPFILADYNRDGVVGADDARSILRLSVGMADAIPFRTPMIVYEGDWLRITLADVTQKYNEGYGENIIVYNFMVWNKTEKRMSVWSDSVTLNGHRLPDDEDYNDSIMPNGSGMRQVIIPTSRFKESRFAQGKVEELLVRFLYARENDQYGYYSTVALYPTGKAPGTVGYLPAGTKYAVSSDNDKLTFGFINAASEFTEYPGKGRGVEYIYATYYFKNKTDHDMSVVFSDIDLDGVPFGYDSSCFVFAHTTATPDLFMDENYFYNNFFKDFKKLSYTITVTDMETGETLLSEDRAITKS